MGKVISLKLTKQEERIVRRLNAEGITNSELLRAALWDYFEPTDYSKNPVAESSSYNRSEIANNSLYTLKEEVSQLRENHDKIQEEFSKELDRLRTHLSQPTPVIKLTRNEEVTPREQYVMDIHKNIDDILKRKER